MNKSMATKPKLPTPTSAENGDDYVDDVPQGLLLPSSIARGKAKAAAKVEAEPTTDLFGLCKSCPTILDAS